MGVTYGKMMMIDASKCMGCKACQIACQQWHSLEAEQTTLVGRTCCDTYQQPSDMSGTNLTVVKFCERTDPNDGKPRWFMFKDQCRHCEIPECYGPQGKRTSKRNPDDRICPARAVKMKTWKNGGVWKGPGFVYIKTEPGNDKTKPAGWNPLLPATLPDVRYCGSPGGNAYVNGQAAPIGPFGPGTDACATVYPGVPICSLVCPYKSCPPAGIPRSEYTDFGGVATTATNSFGNPVMMKCDFCYDRFPHTGLKSNEGNATAQDGPRFKETLVQPSFAKKIKSNRPACEKTCPSGAIRSGDYSGIKKAAKRRVKRLIAQGFADACLYPTNPDIEVNGVPGNWGGFPTRIIWVLPHRRDICDCEFFSSCAGAGAC